MRCVIAVLIGLAANIFTFFPAALKEITGKTISTKDALTAATLPPKEMWALTARRLSRNPADVEALCARAGALWMQKRFMESARDAHAALELDPWNMFARDILIDSLEKIGRRQEIQTENRRGNYLRRLVTQLAEDIDHSRYKAAETRLSRHLDAYPYDARALILRAALRRQLRSYGASAEDARAALAIAPWNQDRGFRWTLIGNLVNEGRYWEAFKEIRSVQRQEGEGTEAQRRQVRPPVNYPSIQFSGAGAVSSVDIIDLYERLDMDFTFSELNGGTSATHRQRWLYLASRWFTVFSYGLIVLSQILIIGAYCSRFSVKRPGETF